MGPLQLTGLKIAAIDYIKLCYFNTYKIAESMPVSRLCVSYPYQDMLMKSLLKNG